MSSLNKTLQQLEQADHRNLSRSLPYLLFHQRFYHYVLVRLKWPFISAIFVSLIHYLFWKRLSLIFPLLDWSDYFIYFQYLFIVGIITHSATETYRIERRASPFKNPKSGFLIILFSLVPFLMVLFYTLQKLQYEGRYFSISDATLLVLCIRPFFTTWIKLALSLQTSSQRIPMNLFTWLVPPLLPLIILFCFSTFTHSLSPWIFPFCLGIESFSFFVFQLFRLEQPRSLLHLLKPSWSLSLNLKSILFRVCLSFPVLLYHVLIVLIFKSKVLEPSTALLLHVLQPSLNLIYQMSSLFWVEHLQYYSVRGIFIKLRKLFLWISFIWWLVFLILQIDLYWMAPLIWVQFELLNFWLGIPANSNQRLLPTSLSTSLKSWKVKTVRSFWNQQKRETLLKKYPRIFNLSPSDGYLNLTTDYSEMKLQKIFAGISVSIQPGHHSMPIPDFKTLPNVAHYSYTTLSWIQPFSQDFKNQLQVDDQILIIKLGLKNSSIFSLKTAHSSQRGSLQLSKFKVKWYLVNDQLYVLTPSLLFNDSQKHDLQ